MNLPCLTQKIELNCIIPALRYHLIEMLERKGMKDSEIAKRLNITKSAVSQYKHKKRGKIIKFPKEIIDEIGNSAEVIAKGRPSNVEISKIIDKIKKSRFICVICRGCECK